MCLIGKFFFIDSNFVHCLEITSHSRIIYYSYNIVLHIFQAHAKTREAQLQIALAEIPYLR